jgi:hypothetical protein
MILQRTSPQGRRRGTRGAWRRGREEEKRRPSAGEKGRGSSSQQANGQAAGQQAWPGEEQRLLLFFFFFKITVCITATRLGAGGTMNARLPLVTIATIIPTKQSRMKPAVIIVVIIAAGLHLTLTASPCVAVIWWGTTRWRGICIERME